MNSLSPLLLVGLIMHFSSQ